jgi:hypothetical protein
MHFHIESNLLWSMPLDHSGITHDAIGKNWPNLHVFNNTKRSHDPRCLHILHFAAHVYVSFMTLVCDKGTIYIVQSYNTIFAMFQFACNFLSTLTLLSTNWKWFTWIF